MDQMIEAAKAIEKMGVTGILAGVVIGLTFVVRMLWLAREDCLKKLLDKDE